jgi:hypothetical protein
MDERITAKIGGASYWYWGEDLWVEEGKAPPTRSPDGTITYASAGTIDTSDHAESDTRAELKRTRADLKRYRRLKAAGKASRYTGDDPDELAQQVSTHEEELALILTLRKAAPKYGNRAWFGNR